MNEIVKTMTVQEATPLWNDPRSVHLKRWGETFDIRLDEYHYGHISTYEQAQFSKMTRHLAPDMKRIESES